MDESIKRLLQRLVRRVPTQMLKATLDKWGRLTVAQRQTIDFTQSKWAITQKLLAVCEVSIVVLELFGGLQFVFNTACHDCAVQKFRYNTSLIKIFTSHFCFLTSLSFLTGK